jgi:hypothetical protein
VDAQLPQDVVAAMHEERADMLRGDALRSLVFVTLSAGAVLLFGLGKMKRWMFIAAMAVLVAGDMIPVNVRFLPQSLFVEKSAYPVEPTPADMYILEDHEPGFRVHNTTVSTFNDATTSFFHRSVGGYHGAKLARYQDLIEHHLYNPSSPVYNMLNTKYIISMDKEQEGQYSIKINPHRTGAAWFVDRLLTVDNPADEIDALDEIDLKSEAVVDNRFADIYGKASLEGVDNEAEISLKIYRPNYLRYKSTSSCDEIAVFSEIYYPNGWSVTIDDKPAEYFRVNYVLRAMVIPAGEHKIEWRFEIPEFRKYENITLASSIAILAAIVAAAVATIIRNRKRA